MGQVTFISNKKILYWFWILGALFLPSFTYHSSKVYSMGWKAAKARGEDPKAGGTAARLKHHGTTTVKYFAASCEFVLMTEWDVENLPKVDLRPWAQRSPGSAEICSLDCLHLMLLRFGLKIL